MRGSIWKNGFASRFFQKIKGPMVDFLHNIFLVFAAAAIFFHKIQRQELQWRTLLYTAPPCLISHKRFPNRGEVVSVR